MEFKGVKGKLYRLSEFIMAIAYLNILWIIFTLFGGIILGIHPASIALVACIKDWRENDVEQVNFRNFKENFKKEFKQANILGIFITLLVSVSVINGSFVYANRAIVHPVLTMTFMIAVIVLMVLLIYVYPVYVYFRKSTVTTIVYSITIGMAHPFMTFMILVFVSLLFIGIYSTSGLALFFGVSALAYVIVKYTCKVFETLTLKSAEKASTS